MKIKPRFELKLKAKKKHRKKENCFIGYTGARAKIAQLEER
jgi:hypothetical protein